MSPAPDRLALLGGAPVRAAPPEPRPRLLPAEAASVAASLAGAADWSRASDDWPLPCLDRLEQRWAEAHAVRHAVAVSSGTAGLTLVLRALRLPPGDEVLIPAYGCPAVDMAVLAAGLTPVHVDLDPRTYGLSVPAAAAALTPRTAALVAVHFAGQPAHLALLARVAEQHGIALVEDVCLAPGAQYEGRAVGGWGVAGVFSLGVRKPISSGEGGLITTNDAALAERLRAARSLGAERETGEIMMPSGNYRLTELQAAVALPQLERLEADARRRSEAAAALEAAARRTGCLTPLETDARASHGARAQLWLRYDEARARLPRERFVAAVQAEGIPLFSGWERPNYAHPVYTQRQAAEWLRRIDSGRAPDHYERTCCPHAERAAFGEAVLFDFPLLDAEAEVIRDAARALEKVAAHAEVL